MHIIEVKDLAPRDNDGLNDPFVMAECFGQKFTTATISNTLSAVFDEQLFLEGKEQKSESLNTQVVKISVFNANTLPMVKNDLIGEFTIDLLSIYYEPHHEIYRRWVALTAPASARKNGAVKGGVQGYVKMTLALLGPGDKPHVHKANEEEPTDSIMLPPSLKLSLVFLIIRVHRAENLPQARYTALIETEGRTLQLLTPPP